MKKRTAEQLDNESEVNESINDSNRTEDDEPKVQKAKKGKYEKTPSNADKKNNKQKVGNEKGSQNSKEKPNWVEFKKKKKELKEKYKAKKLNDVYDISVEVKHIGEKLRRSDCSKLDRKKLVSKTHDLLKTYYSKVVLSHDMSRIVQWLLKYCDAEIRKAIFEELKPLLLVMIESKYAKNCIKNMLKYGNQEIKDAIISACYGKVVKLISHNISAPLLEIMYSTYATDTQKIYFKQEFYGDMYKQAKDKNVKSLSDVFKTAEAMKKATLSAVKGNLMRVLNKFLLGFTLVQSVLLEFLENCTNEDRSEMIVGIRDSIAQLCYTKVGSKVAIISIWNGTNKDRKIMMKLLKEHVQSIAMSEHGYMVLLALFDSIDDTVLLNKLILSEIQKGLTDIALNDHGKHVILYLVARRNSHYFPPSIVEYLKQGDDNPTSKKPADIREKELVNAVSNAFLESVATNTAIWMSKSSIAMVTLAILKVGAGEKLKEAFNSIAEYITSSESKIKDEDKEIKPIEHAGLHMMLKKLVQNDKELREKEVITFGEVLLDHLENSVIEEWITCNRGCFLLIFLLENEKESTIETLRSKLKPIVRVLKTKSCPGASILLKKLV